MSQPVRTNRWAAADPLPDLPHSIDAERTLLGTLVAFDNTFASVADLPRPEDFHEPAHFHLFSTMSGMTTRGEKITVVSLVGLLCNDPGVKSLDQDLPSGWKPRPPEARCSGPQSHMPGKTAAQAAGPYASRGSEAGGTTFSLRCAR